MHSEEAGMSLKLNDRFVEKFLVSEQVYEGFTSLFNDKNPLHTDEQFAAARGFAGKVMHGNILNGFLSYFIGECLPIKNVIIHTQSIQYRKPVYLNQALVLEAQVLNVVESVNAVEMKFSFRNELLEEVARGKVQIGILV